MKKIIGYFIVIITSSNLTFCQGSKQLDECINENLAEKHNYSDIDMFHLIQEFEDFLIEEDYLDGKKKKNYDALIESTMTIKEFNKLINKVKKNIPYFYDVNDDSLNMIMMYNQCPTDIARDKNFKKRKYLAPIKLTYDKIIANGYPKKFILEELSNKIDYEDHTSRLMLCNLIYKNWQAKYFYKVDN